MQTVLLGDAAHCMSPVLGQGLNSGLEDVAIFAECLQQHAGQVDTALPAYTAARMPDIRAIMTINEVAASQDIGLAPQVKPLTSPLVVCKTSKLYRVTYICLLASCKFSLDCQLGYTYVAWQLGSAVVCTLRYHVPVSCFKLLKCGLLCMHTGHISCRAGSLPLSSKYIDQHSMVACMLLRRMSVFGDTHLHVTAMCVNVSATACALAL